ncbi:MAG: SpoIIE family protein phosphatase [Planctomycetaceae bacterium]|nr:SpoIIE family protein phosphatase [Planctomycetaceae bacterium]
MTVLKVVKGSNPGAVYELHGERTVMGRHPNCHVVLDNGAVSRHHAQVLESHGSYFLEDLRSRNGTFLNGEQLESRTELNDGDEIRVCDIVMTFEMHGSSSETAPPVPPRGPNLSQVGERTTREQIRNVDSALSLDESVAAASIPSYESSSVIGTIDARRRSNEIVGQHPEIKLQAVLEITRALGRELEVDAVLPKVLAALFQIFPQAAQGFVLLKDPDSPKLVVKATRVRKGSEADAVAVSMTVVRQAMESAQGLLSQNALEDSRFKQSASLTRMQIRSVMCAPLVGQEGTALGVIQIVTRGSDEVFNNDDLDLLVSVASQAALAIENATLHEQLLLQREFERDLEFATQVQLGFLPKARPRVPQYAFSDYYEAALRIGGDYFDYIGLPGGQLAVTLGDVAGKGMPAALLMARLYSSARYQLLTSPTPAAAMAGLNKEIASSGLGHRFITLLVAVLDPAKHEVTLVNAGHLAPLVKRINGNVEAIGREESGLPLGIVPDQEFKSSTHALYPGELLVAYTDGVTEAMNEEREIFGRRRLEECIAKETGDIDAVMKAIIGEVEAFVGENTLRDDTCIVGLQRLAK